ncbi:hypothetical protein LZ30DRAFT_238265 [Colletotrichum cereale]|nr:hypothetical protein LZ30DRAFT_238265 [Colletotrichum cereale]
MKSAAATLLCLPLHPCVDVNWPRDYPQRSKRSSSLCRIGLPFVGLDVLTPSTLGPSQHKGAPSLTHSRLNPCLTIRESCRLWNQTTRSSSCLSVSMSLSQTLTCPLGRPPYPYDRRWTAVYRVKCRLHSSFAGTAEMPNSDGVSKGDGSWERLTRETSPGPFPPNTHTRPLSSLQVPSKRTTNMQKSRPVDAVAAPSLLLYSYGVRVLDGGAVSSTVRM